MAFIGEVDQEDILANIQDRIQKINEVAEVRDEVFAANQDKPLKIVLWGTGIAWAIYHFLIKR